MKRKIDFLIVALFAVVLAVDTTKSLFVHVKCLYCRGKRISGEIGRRLVSVVKMHE